jgi:biotin carboxylase
MRNKKQTAVVLGGTHDHIRLIELLAAHGYRTVLVDYYENPPARAVASQHIQASTMDMERVVQIAGESQASLVVAACIDQALATMAYACEQLNLKSHLSYRQALQRTNKLHMKRVFDRYCIPTARWCLVGNDAFECPVDWCWPLVVKPADSNSSKGVTRVTTRSKLDEAVAFARRASRSGQVIIEEFKSGCELSVDVVVESGVPRIVMISENIKMTANADAFTILQNVAHSHFHAAFGDKCLSIAARIAEAFDVQDSPMLIQMIGAEDGLYVVEFSSRIGGGSKHHFIHTMTGFDILKHYVDWLTDSQSPEAGGSRRHAVGAMNYVYAKPGVFDRLYRAESLQADGLITASYLYKQRGSRIEGCRVSSDRPAGFMVVGDSLAELEHHIRVADATLEVHDEQGTDIMMHGIYDDSLLATVSGNAERTLGSGITLQPK